MALDGGNLNSRDSVRAAGWACSKPGSHEAFVPARRPLSWMSPAMLWQSRNDTIAGMLGDPVNDVRRAWMDTVGPGKTAIEHRGQPDVAFMLVGDPGEGDASQWATIPALEATWGGTSFMVLMSDVIYPAGCINEYEAKFYKPYQNFDRPIYGIPGNHDWYDDLHGFMFHLCGVDQCGPVDPSWRHDKPRWKRLLHRLLWRSPDVPEEGIEGKRAMWRPHATQQSTQRTPYWTIELDAVRLVGIDTGISGGIDRDQGEWLRSVSLSPDAGDDRPKILITGKPIYVDGEYHPGPIEGGGTIDEIVRDPDAGYIAAIGGDVHNYQRYPIEFPDGRTIQYIVAGGGGAFMHPTHTIPRVRLPGCDERAFRCYPRRGDSLSIFSKLYDKRLAFGRGSLELSPDEAAAYMADQLGIPAARDTSQVVVGKRVRRAAGRIMPLPGRWQGPLHPLLSIFFDMNEPPMFKSFLRIDTSPGRIAIRCHAATGCQEHEADPPLEDAVVAEPDGGRAWRWRSGLDDVQAPNSAPAPGNVLSAPAPHRSRPPAAR